MSVKIGHARIDENGKATGGQPGDQNGKELRIQNWYDGGWAFLARHKDQEAAKWIANACEAACANENIGYDQSGRNTLLQQAKAVHWDLSSVMPCECDCSSLVSCCVMASGVQIWSGGNAPTTRTLRKVLQESGKFEILTGAEYLTDCTLLNRGDILCTPGKHTVIVLSDGTQPREEVPVVKPAVKTTYDLPVLNRGDQGAAVAAMQALIVAYGGEAADLINESGGYDGIFGSGTDEALKLFQEAHDLEADGVCGPLTWAKLLGIK